MKKGILILMIGSFTLLSSTNAQDKKEHHGKQEQGSYDKSQSECKLMNLPNLTEAQKADLKSLNLNFEEQSLPLKNRINEINARQTTLLSTDNDVSTELTTLISDEYDLKEKLDLLKANHVMEIKSKLTAEQKVVYNTHIAEECKHKSEMEMHNKGEMHGQNCKSNEASSTKAVTKEATTK
jgi:hypothetical protein